MKSLYLIRTLSDQVNEKNIWFLHPILIYAFLATVHVYRCSISDSVSLFALKIIFFAYNIDVSSSQLCMYANILQHHHIIIKLVISKLFFYKHLNTIIKTAFFKRNLIHYNKLATFYCRFTAFFITE